MNTETVAGSAASSCWADLYDVILTDPPWSYYGQQDKMGAAGKEYTTMPDDELLLYRYPLRKTGVLFMWATSPKLDFAIDCIKAHGLHYRGVAFVWVKTTKHGSPMGACGVRPSIVKPTTEYVISASYVPRGRPMKLHDESIIQTVFAPRTQHSKKPQEVHERICRMYPFARKAEFFARRHTDGWDCFGDELPPNTTNRQPESVQPVLGGVNEPDAKDKP